MPIIRYIDYKIKHISNKSQFPLFSLKKALETNDSLKTALSNQEEYTKTVCEENNALQEKLAALEEEKAVAAAAVQDLRDALRVVFLCLTLLLLASPILSRLENIL